MKRITYIIGFLFSSLILLILGAHITGCSQQTPISPIAENSSPANRVAGQPAKSDVGIIHILQVNDKKKFSFNKSSQLTDAKAKNLSEIKFFSAKTAIYYNEKFIQAHKGGEVKVGDGKVGKSELEFPKNALPEDMTISFCWASCSTFEGMVNSLEFGPHGTVFNKPVEAKFSYKNADLTGIDEESLQIFYYNQNTDEWELIGGKVDVRKKVVTGELHHFSRYAIAFSR